jgi:hypothetical protein
MNNQSLIDLIVELAQETDVVDPLDWGELNIDETTAFRLMATHVLEMDLSEPYVTQAIITKLLVENFVLNLKLLRNNI